MEPPTIERDPKHDGQIRSLPKMSFKERAATEFCVKLGKSFTETFQMLVCAYGKDNISRPEVNQWYTRFKHGGRMLESDEESSHRGLEIDLERVDTYKEDELIEEHPHTTMDAALSLPTSISVKMEDDEDCKNGTAETSTEQLQTSDYQEDISCSAIGAASANFNRNPQNQMDEMKHEVPTVMLESDSESSEVIDFLSDLKSSVNSKLAEKGSSGPNKCHICSRVYKSYDILRAHLKIHAATHKCSQCGATFANSYKLKQHAISHSDVKQFGCSICHKDFGYKHNLRRHMWMCHNQPDSTSQASNSEELFKCTICDWTLRGLTELNRHMMGHAKSKPLLHHKCTKCDKTFTRMAHLNRHLRTHLPTKSHQCDYCGKSFSEAFDLKRHRKQHLESIDASSPEPYAFPPQDSNIIVAMEPQETVYPDVVSFTGDMDRDFEQAAYPVDEMVEHNEYFQETVPIKMEPDDATSSALVDMNGGSFKQAAGVSTTANAKRATNGNSELPRAQAIQKSEGTGNSSMSYHRCHVCFKLYKRRDVLMRHLNLHSGCFQCDRCNLTFSSPAHLETHMKRHLGIKPHKCSFCEKAFTTTGELKTHTKRHLGVREHKCNVCPKKFFAAHGLRLHMRKHIEEN